ncbi:MAG: replicative DNA helicase, partial [Caldilineae bacterium]|nr:replicative DNA helicase [Caldilineae bacterium]
MDGEVYDLAVFFLSNHLEVSVDNGFGDISPMSRERFVPANPEAEQAVLGSLLIDPDAVIKVASFLKAEDFYQEKNGWIYQTIVDLHERRDPADFVTVTDELERRRQLIEVGGAAYVMDLINAVPTAIHVEHYGHIVERASVLRQLIRAAGQIAQLAYEDTAENVQEVVDRAEQIIFGVAEERTDRSLVPVRSIMGDVVDRIDFLYHHRGEILGVPTGFRLLDKMLGGLAKSDLVILAARPGVGKTSLAISVAQAAARKYGKRVAVFSLEMSNEQLVQRMLAAETGIDSQRLRLGDIHGEDEWHRLMEAAGALSDAPIFIDDTPAISVLELRTKARRLYAEHDLDMVVVDYLQLMTGSDRRNENRVQEISAISRGLKSLARELNVPVLALSQLSRAVESRQDKRPILSDLRESGCLTGDTRVFLPDSGQYTPIRETVGTSGFQVAALNTNSWKIETATVSRSFSTGIKPVFRLETRLGRSIRATANHRFLTIDGWRRLDELEPGTHVALPRVLEHRVDHSMSDVELALLGHLIGDGCTLPRHAIQYTTREKDLADLVASLATDVFKGEVNPRVQQEPGHDWYQVFIPTTRHITHGVRNPISDWLDSMGVFGLRSHEKYVPDIVFSQSTNSMATFLRHLWATDGCIRMRGGKKHYPAIYYASSSQRLVRDVQSLLTRLGICARLKRVAQNGKGRDQFHVIVSGKEDMLRFAKTVGAVGSYKTDALNQIVEYLNQQAANTNRDVIPAMIWTTFVKPSMVERGMTHRELHAELEMAYAGTAVFKQNVSRDRARRVADVVQSDELLRLANSDVYWDQVHCIQPDGVEEVFDLTVPGTHNFIANDIVVHN